MGLSDDKIAEFQGLLGTQFPQDFRVLLRAMNGTDLPTLNVYANCGEPARQWVGVYSYQRDLGIVRRLIEDVSKDRIGLTDTLAQEGFALQPTAALVPVYGHRYLVCTSPDSSVVLSIDDSDDAIVYGNSLKEFNCLTPKELVEYHTKRHLLVLLHALESLLKLRDQRSFAGLETVASHDAPEKIATRVMCIIHGHQIFGGSARH